LKKKKDIKCKADVDEQLITHVFLKNIFWLFIKKKYMEKINGVINIVDLFNLIRLLNYEIWNNYYLSDLSYYSIYNNYLRNYGLWSISVLILIMHDISYDDM